MVIIEGSTVRATYPMALSALMAVGRPEDSRAGPVIRIPVPVTVVTAVPWMRVLLDPKRDANPFFHLAESLWMLAGRNDARFLDRYVSDFSTRFAEPNGDQHGAYGWRWRNEFGDQIKWIVRRLRRSPNDRQAVLAAWWPELDANDKILKDRPCNTHVYFGVVDGRLHTTVCQRSGDLIWGTFGANAVHMSVLAEYVSAFVGVKPGPMWQVVNNLHAYESALPRVYPPSTAQTEVSQAEYESFQQLVTFPGVFDAELHDLLGWVEGGAVWPSGVVYENDFFRSVAEHVLGAHALYREGDVNNALEIAYGISALDWRAACVQWIERRVERQKEKVS